jgi:hypothetical protein
MDLPMLCILSGSLVSYRQHFIMKLGIYVLRGEGDVGKRFLSVDPRSANSITFQACIFARNHVGKRPVPVRNASQPKHPDF